MNEIQLIKDLIRDEGEELKPYVDTVGKITLGVGRNLTDVGITREESRFLLQNDINRVTKSLDQFLPWWSQLDDVRQRALANMAFNMGIAGLLTFRKMVAALERKDWGEAARQAKDSVWYTQVGNRADRIIQMFLSGNDP